MKSLLLAIAALLLASLSCAAEEISAEITDAKLSLAETDERSFVYTVGLIRNEGEHTLLDVQVEARYFDSEGILVDTASMEMYSTVIEPGEDVAFRLSSPTAVDADKYVSQQVRVIGGYVDSPEIAEQSPSAWSKWRTLLWRLFISSFPILLLIAAWIYFMRKMGGKNSQQSQMMALIAEQNKLMEKQVNALDRLAESVSAKESN